MRNWRVAIALEIELFPVSATRTSMDSAINPDDDLRERMYQIAMGVYEAMKLEESLGTNRTSWQG